MVCRVAQSSAQTLRQLQIVMATYVAGIAGLAAVDRAGVSRKTGCDSSGSLFGNPDRSAYRISPDGKTLSFLQIWEGHLNLSVEPIEGGEGMRLTSETTDDVGKGALEAAQFGKRRRLTSWNEADIPPDYFWKGNDYIVFRQDQHGDENFHFYRIATKAKNPKPEDLTPFQDVHAELIDDLAGISDTDILIALNHRDRKIFDVCRLNVIKLDPSKIATVVRNDFGALSWLTDNAGCVRVAVAHNGSDTILYTRPDEKSRFTPARTTNFRDSIDPQGFTIDNKYVYAISNVGRDKAALVLIDPAKNAEEIRAPLFEHKDVDLGSLDFSKKRKVPTCVTYWTSKMERKFLDADTEKLFQTLSTKLPGYVLSVTAHDDAEEEFVVAASNDRTPGTRYLFNIRTQRLRKLNDIAPSVKEADMAPMWATKYDSDGWSIPAYLTLPVGRGEKNLPTIIYPHGGPWQRDGWEYNSEVQFFANRGYTVLQIELADPSVTGKSFGKPGSRSGAKKSRMISPPGSIG